MRPAGSAGFDPITRASVAEAASASTRSPIPTVVDADDGASRRVAADEYATRTLEDDDDLTLDDSAADRRRRPPTPTSIDLDERPVRRA